MNSDRGNVTKRFNELYKDGRIKFITFHQSYSYEEFIEGLKPKLNKDKKVYYDIEDGVFKEFCKKASKDDPSNIYVLIIDEINRGNIPKIFGELITLIESDKRNGAVNAIPVTLPYSKETFCIPSNLYIIGTMNTADKSIALLDVALRRRFKFYEIMPDSALLYGKVINGISLKDLLENINKKIEVFYDRDHQIGHSYFLKVNNVDDLKVAWYYEIIPLLQEYFYDDWDKIKEIIGEFVGVTEASKIIKINYKDIDTEKNVYRINNITDNQAFIKALSGLFESEKDGGST